MRQQEAVVVFVLVHVKKEAYSFPAGEAIFIIIIIIVIIIIIIIELERTDRGR
jgi:hypothetical protein